MAKRAITGVCLLLGLVCQELGRPGRTAPSSGVGEPRTRSSAVLYRWHLCYPRGHATRLQFLILLVAGWVNRRQQEVIEQGNQTGIKDGIKSGRPERLPARVYPTLIWVSFS